MSKIFGFYGKNKGVDTEKMWYDSSNIKYSELLDLDNKLKVLKVVFNNGTQYQYKDVNVNDYLMFREDLSQGKALNKYIKGKGYEYEKLEDADLDELNNELDFRANEGIFVFYDNGKFVMKDNKDKVICEKDVVLTESSFDTVCSALEAVGKKIYSKGENFFDYGERGTDEIISESPF